MVSSGAKETASLTGLSPELQAAAVPNQPPQCAVPMQAMRVQAAGLSPLPRSSRRRQTLTGWLAFGWLLLSVLPVHAQTSVPVTPLQAPAQAPASKPAPAPAAAKTTDAAQTQKAAPAKAADAAQTQKAAPAKAADAAQVQQAGGAKAPAGKAGAPGKAAAAAPAAKAPVAQKLVVPPKSPPVSKAEVFQKAAPATVMLVAKKDNNYSATLGVIVKPQGVVVSDARLLSGVEQGQVFAFLYDPSLAGDEDPLSFLRSHQDLALPAQVVRVDSVSRLVMLKLPEPPAKKPYRSLDLYDMRGVATVGVEVVALRTRGRQTLAMSSGSIGAVRSDMVEMDPPLSMEHSGGPILTATGRLVGISTFSDKSTSTAGLGRPIEAIVSLLAGQTGAAPPEKPIQSVPELGSDSRNLVEAVRISLGLALGQKLERRTALHVHSEFIGAMALRGKAAIAGLDSVETINGIISAMVKENPAKTKVVAELFPLLLSDKAGRTWRKMDTKVPQYEVLRPSGFGIAAVDDVTGGMYATDTKKQLMWFDLVSKTWRNSGISGVAQVRATEGKLFMLLDDGRLMIATSEGKDTLQLYPRSLKNATLSTSAGTLYLVENGSVYRYKGGSWDQKLKPIAFAMTQLVSRGGDWYAMDQTGRVFSSQAMRYIDRDNNILHIWPLGKDLLVTTKDNSRFYYSVAENSWRAWTQW